MASFFHHLQAAIGGRWLGWNVIAALGCTYAAALYLACVVVIRGLARRRALVALSIASTVLMLLTGVRAELEWSEATSLPDNQRSSKFFCPGAPSDESPSLDGFLDGGWKRFSRA